jgi:hypothetical protein
MVHYDSGARWLGTSGLILFLIAELSAQPSIDIRGQVMTGNAPLPGVQVSLKRAGLTDTTDDKGQFHLSGNPAALREGLSGRPTSLTANPNAAAYNAAGRTVMFAIEGKEGRYGSAKGWWTGENRPASLGKAQQLSHPVSLEKSAAAVDSIVLSKPGYQERIFPLSNYVLSLDTIGLLAASQDFPIRKPSEHTIPCNGVTATHLEQDMVCEIENDSLRASVYIRTQPISCGPMSAVNYKTDGGWIRDAQGVQALAQIAYDGGGNHHNDRATFFWNGRFYSVYHSSFGFGWRACAPPDCMQVCQDLECRSIVYDGCSRSACDKPPALKVRCAVVQADGKVPERVDYWTAASGTQNAMMPCRGDTMCK